MARNHTKPLIYCKYQKIPDASIWNWLQPKDKYTNIIIVQQYSSLLGVVCFVCTIYIYIYIYIYLFYSVWQLKYNQAAVS